MNTQPRLEPPGPHPLVTYPRTHSITAHTRTRGQRSDTQSDLQALGRRVRSSALEVLLVVGLVGVRVGVPLLHDLHVARALCSKFAL